MQRERGGVSLYERRELSISIIKVELQLYRRTRTSCDIARVPPNFVYHLRFEWAGDALPRSPPSASPRSPRVASTMGSPSKTGGFAEGPFPEPPFWESLPRSYIVKRRWHEIVRFHEALVNDLTFDAATGSPLVKTKVPTLPSKADIDSWMNSYAATGDVCALSRTQKLDPPSAVAPQGKLLHHAEAPMKDLKGLHWIYVELRLAPYFKQVNNVLREIGTNVLGGSIALRRFVLPGSRAAMQKPPCNAMGVPRRFLGTLEPVSASGEDIEAAVQAMRRTNPGVFRSLSAPSLGLSKRPGSSAASAAAAKLVAAGSSAAAAAKPAAASAAKTN